MKNNTIYEKTYLAGKKNKWNAILNFIYIALCLAYFLIVFLTTTNTSGEFGEGLFLALRLIASVIALGVASVAVLINGITSIIIAPKLIKMSQDGQRKKGVYIASIIIKIIAVIALLYSAGIMALFGASFLLESFDLRFIGDLLLALLLMSMAIYQIVLIVQEQKSRKELASV